MYLGIVFLKKLKLEIVHFFQFNFSFSEYCTNIGHTKFIPIVYL